MNRTYVTFFGGDSTKALELAYLELLQDWNNRSSYIDSKVKWAGDYRLELLRLAIILLKDKVPE